MIPKTIEGMVFGARNLKYWVLAPSGRGSSNFSEVLGVKGLDSTLAQSQSYDMDRPLDMRPFRRRPYQSNRLGVTK